MKSFTDTLWHSGNVLKIYRNKSISICLNNLVDIFTYTNPVVLICHGRKPYVEQICPCIKARSGSGIPFNVIFSQIKFSLISSIFKFFVITASAKCCVNNTTPPFPLFLHGNNIRITVLEPRKIYEMLL